MADISAEITAFRDAAYGEDVRSALIQLAQKLNGNILSELAIMQSTWNSYKNSVDEDLSDFESAWNSYKSNFESAWDTYKSTVNSKFGHIDGIIRGLAQGVHVTHKNGTIIKSSNGYIFNNFSVWIFDSIAGYRYTASQTFTFNPGDILYFSSTENEFTEVDLSVRGTGETIYLYNVAGYQRYSYAHNFFAFNWRDSVVSIDDIVNHCTVSSTRDGIDHYITQYDLTKQAQMIDLKDIEPYMNCSILDKNLNIVGADQHGIVKLPSDGLCELKVMLQDGFSNEYPAFIFYNSSDQVMRTIYYNQLHAAGDHSAIRTCYVRLPAKGLPEGSYILINHFYRNTGTQYIKSISCKWYSETKYISHGKNLCDPYITLENGYYFYYIDGNLSIDTNYQTYPIDVQNKSYLSVNNSTHAVCIDEWGNYLEGHALTTANGLTLEIPNGTNTVLASISHRYSNELQIEYSNSPTSYEPFKPEFNGESGGQISGGRYEFDIPINQVSIINNQSSTKTETVDSETFEQVHGILCLPNTYSNTGTAVPLIMITHGAGYYVLENDWRDAVSTFVNLRNAFLNAGYAICDINGYKAANHNTWGCPRAIQAYRKLYEYVTSKYNVQKEVNIYGFSMGGIVGLNFMLHNRDIVKAMALSSPVTDLYTQVWKWSVGRRSDTVTAYDFVIPSGVTISDPITQDQEDVYTNNLDKRLGYNPTDLIQNGVISVPFPNIRIWHGQLDEAVPYQQSVNLINALRAGGQDATIRLVTNAAHEICWGENAIMNQEYVMFFNRFNSK